MPFRCIVCGSEETPFYTGFKPRDRAQMDCVRCMKCGHNQLFPLLTEDEYKKEYNEDLTIKSTSYKIALNGEFETLRKKWGEWTRYHVNLYYGLLQEHRKVIDLGSGYGFFEEMLNAKEGNHFTIEGVEIGDIRIKQYVGGKVHKINFSSEAVPEHMAGRYDLVMCMHLLEHLTDPYVYLQNIKPLVTKGGKFLFEVPNHNTYLRELSKEYESFFYCYEHVSNYDENSLKYLLQRAGYKIDKIYTKEPYSLENHINWVRKGKPNISYNQVYMPDGRLEFVNDYYHEYIEAQGKGYCLIAEASLPS